MLIYLVPLAIILIGKMMNNDTKTKPIKLMLPLQGRISSPFGNRTRNGKIEFHNGVDISAVLGTEIKAPADGIIQKQYNNALGGNQMLVKHDNGYITGYAHLHSFNIGLGQRCKQGQVIARVGNTGTTLAHLHLTLRNEQLQILDPLLYMSA